MDSLKGRTFSLDVVSFLHLAHYTVNHPTPLPMKRLIIVLCAAFLVSATKDELHRSFDLKSVEKLMVCIPKGSFIFYDSSSEMNWNLKTKVPSKRVVVDSFYIYAHEVSNNDYHLFLNELKVKDMQQYVKMAPDTAVWNHKPQFQEPYYNYYFWHPAYGDYPVVGVTHTQAEAYCNWLTEKYMSQEKRKFKKVKFALPTLYQWEYAAIGGAKDYADFPWKGPFMRNAKGLPMANFMKMPESSIKKETFYVKDSAGGYKEVKIPVASSFGALGVYDQKYESMAPSDCLAPVDSYWPNGYGLYNMAGNVKEYVRENGITKGGGWKDTGFYLMNWVEQAYDSNEEATNDRGFRFVMEVLK
jgi:formylglycine-generating enzyme required for sulfatase activity